MKNFFIKSVFIIFFASFGICSASIPQNEISLGGLTFGSSFGFMEKIYGKPDYFYKEIGKSGAYLYGESVIIHYNGDLDRIETIIVENNNGWKTPAGLSVGMNISDAKNFYGEPDYTSVGEKNSAWLYFHYNKNIRDYGLIILFDNASEKISELSIRGDTPNDTFENYYKSHMNEVIIPKL